MKTNLSIKDELLSAIRQNVAKFWAQVVGRSMRLQSVGYHANLSTKIGIRSRIGSRTLLSTLLLLLTFGVGNSWGTVVSENLSDIATANSWTTSAGDKVYPYTSWSLDSHITVSVNSSGNNGSYWSNGWRVYESASAIVTIAAESGYEISSITITYASTKNNGCLSGLTSGTADNFSPAVTSKTYTVSHSSGSSKGQVGITAISVTYSSTGGGSTPTLTTSSSMTTLTYSNGSPVAQSFTIGGSNLTNTVTVTAPTDYEVCKTSGGTYVSSVSFTNTEVNAANKTVYIRLQSGLSAGNIASRNITVASSGADSKTIAVTGSVPYTITWMANGSTFTTTYVAVGSTLTLPGSTPDPATYSCSGKAFYGWYGAGSSYSNASVAPSIAAAGNAVSADKTYYAVFADAEEESGTLSIDFESATSAFTNWTFNNFTSNQSGSITAHGGSKYGTTDGNASGYVKTNNKIASPTSLSVFVSKQSSNTKSSTWYIKVSSDGSTWSTVTSKSATSMSAGDWEEMTADLSSYSNVYVELYYSGSTAVRNMDDLVLEYGNTTYSNYATSCGACTASAAIGTASLNGPFNLSTVGVQCASITPGTNCSVASGDYGFIWYAGTGNKKLNETGVTTVAVTSGAYSSGSFSKNLTSTFSLGSTYTFRAFAINGKPDTVYSAAVSFTPRSVTFNLNSHGSSAPSTQYVNNGGKATDPSYSEIVSGWRFDGWYGNASCTGNAWSFADSIVSGANRTLYAKWTQVYSVTYAYAGGTSSCSDDTKYAAGATVTVCATEPTKAGSTFLGWLGDNSVGTKAAGATFSMPAANVTLTAQWEDTEYTLTQTKSSHTTSSVSATKIKSGDLVSTGKDFVYTISNIAANAGYALPKTPTLSGGGQTWERGTNYTWTLSDDRHSATLHIAADLTISANLTINVSEVTRYLVEWDEHGSIDSVYYASDDNSVTMKTGIDDCGTKKFYCWTENSSFVSDASTPPTAASSGSISGDKHYYAIYGDRAGGDGYTLVTSITAGSGYYMATGLTSSDKVYTGQNSSNDYGSCTANNSSGSSFNDGGTLLAFPTAAKSITVAIRNGQFSMYDGSKYLHVSSDANELKFVDTTAYQWKLNSNKIQSGSYTSRYIKRNTQNERVCAYSTTSSVADFYLYKPAVSWTNFAKTCKLYDISITSPSHGEVSTSPTAGTDAAGAGQTITVTATPDDCYYLSALVYNDGSDHDILSTKSFTMPLSDVTITATFSAKSVSSIAATTSTHRTLMHGTSFVGEQITVTYSDGSTEVLDWDDEDLTFSGYNMSTLDDYTVTVSYDGDCGDAECEYDIEVVDGVPITFSDAGITRVAKYDVSTVVNVSDSTGRYACSGWEFVGWCDSAVTHNSPAGFGPVMSLTATTARTLYAVYADTSAVWLSALDSTEIISGATYVIIGQYNSNEKNYALTTQDTLTNYLRRYYLSPSCDKIREEGTTNDRFKMKVNVPAALQWTVYKDGSSWKVRNKGNGKYLKITASALSLTNTPEDAFSIRDNENAESMVSLQSYNSGKYLSYYNSGKYWNAHTSGYTYYCTNMQKFSSTPPCTRRSVKFHGNGGTVTAYGGGSSGGNLVVTEAERDAGIKLPTASFTACDGKTWTFMGWMDEERDLSRVPVLTTELLEDGETNADHTITADDEEYWAVYSSTGEEETKHGTISFTYSDFPSTYSNGTLDKVVNGDTYVIDYKKVGYPSGSGNGIQIGKTDDYDGHIQNTTSLGKINYIRFNTFNVGSISSIHVYVGTSSSSIDTELTSAELQTIGSEYTFYPNGNYSYFKIQSAAYTGISSISVAFGLGTAIYATTPDCSTISLSGDVYVTSRSGIGIMAVTPLSVEAHQLTANADVVITSNSSDVYFSTDRTPNFSKASKPTASVTVRANDSGELSATPIYVHYKPSSTGTGAASDVMVYANLSTPDPNIKGEHTIHVRNLPEKVVIAAKVGGAYYALPADMNAPTNPAGVLIDVNEEDMTATAPENCTYTIWPVKTTSGSEDRYALHEGNAYGERVRFSAPNNTTVNAGLWANNSTSSGDDTNINNNAAIASISADPAAAYEWKITTTVTDGKWSHTLQTDQSTNKNYLCYWTAASGGPKWGTYANGEKNLYLLPVTEITPFEMEVVEWYPTKVLVNTTSDLTGNTLTVRVNGSVDGDAAVTGKGSNLYEISNLDLAGNPTKSLRVDYGTSPINSCTKAIPVIISRSTQNVTAAPFTTLTKEVYSKADLVVRDGAVLTLNGTIAENTFSSVTIYPTAKISVPSDKKLTANSLTFFGGIDDIYNGSTYTVNKYGVPELSLKGRVGKALSTINYDMRVDLSQMYALALPYDVNIAAITYWDGTAMTPGTNLYISAYDGQARVNRESRTWIYEEDFEEKLGAATLKAGVGYTISAEPQSGFGNEYSIIRMPMQAGLTADATEVAKTVAVVAYVNNQGATVTDNHKGWNFVGNPYMASISGGEPDSKLIVGKLVPNNAVEPWDGSYMWDGTTYPYRYVTIPSDDGTENEQKKWADVTLKPFKNFFIQVGSPGLEDGTTGNLSFALSSRADAPARYVMVQGQEVEFEIQLSSTTHKDHTGLLIAEAYSPAYEINADLEKMENPMSVYTLTGGYKLAYNALSPNDAKQPIPVGYIANEAGTYTFQLDEGSDVNEVEHIWLTDYELDRVIDLTEVAYDFTTIVGRNETRFALTIELRTGEEIATDIGNSIDGIDNDGAVKFIWHDKMYILNQGVIYDATGKRVTEINK